MKLEDIQLRPLTWIHTDFSIEGTVRFDSSAYLRGRFRGKILASPGSTLVISEDAIVEGDIQCDRVTVEGFVRGKIVASERIVIVGTGRVLGEISTPKLIVQPGGLLEGRSASVQRPIQQDIQDSR